MKIQGCAQTENYIKQNLKKKIGKPWLLFFLFLYFFLFFYFIKCIFVIEETLTLFDSLGRH
jgi:hypothetical protein